MLAFKGAYPSLNENLSDLPVGGIDRATAFHTGIMGFEAAINASEATEELHGVGRVVFPNDIAPARIPSFAESVRRGSRGRRDLTDRGSPEGGDERTERKRYDPHRPQQLVPAAG